MFFHRHVPFFKQTRTQYWMAGGAAVLLGLAAGMLSEAVLLKGDLHDLTASENFELTEIGVDEGGYVYGAITNTSDAALEIELSLSLEGEEVASSTAQLEPGASMNLSPGLALEPGSHQVKLCASAGEEEVCMEEALSI